MDNYSRVVKLEEIAKNDFNISPSRYLQMGTGEEYRPIGEILADLETLEKEARESDASIRTILQSIVAE